MKNTATIIKKKINHDSLWVSGTMGSGHYIKFAITRRGERLETIGFALEEQKQLMGWMGFRKDELNDQLP